MVILGSVHWCLPPGLLVCFYRTSWVVCKLGRHSTRELCIPSLFLVFILTQDFSKLSRLGMKSLCSPCWPQICNPPASVSQGAEITHLQHRHGSLGASLAPLLSNTTIPCLAEMTVPFHFLLSVPCSLYYPHSPGWKWVHGFNSCCRMMHPTFISKPGKAPGHVQLVTMGYMYPWVPMQVT